MEKKELSKVEKMNLVVDSVVRRLTSFNQRGTKIENAKIEKIESKKLSNYLPDDVTEDSLEKCKGVTFTGVVRITMPLGDGFASDLYNLNVKIELEYIDDNFKAGITAPASISKYISQIP